MWPGPSSKRRQCHAVTCAQGRQQDAVALCKVRVQVSGGVASTSDAGNLLDATTPQLVQGQASIPLCWHLLLIWLDAAHKVELSPAHPRARLSHGPAQASVDHENFGVLPKYKQSACSSTTKLDIAAGRWPPICQESVPEADASDAEQSIGCLSTASRQGVTSTRPPHTHPVAALQHIASEHLESFGRVRLLKAGTTPVGPCSAIAKDTIILAARIACSAAGHLPCAEGACNAAHLPFRMPRSSGSYTDVTCVEACPAQGMAIVACN